MAQQTPMTIVPELTAIAAAYRQANLIADQVMPYVPVSTLEFRYKKFNLADDFSVPDTRVGRKGAPNQVEFGETELTAACEDHGLDSPVPNRDIAAYSAAQAAGQTKVTDPLMRATSQTMKLVMVARERRVANLTFDPANYGVNNKLTLAGPGQWSDPASDPHAAITEKMDSMIMRPNIGVMGRAAWSVVSRNINLVKVIRGRGSERGQLTRAEFAELFELDELHVGDGWINTAAKGQPTNVVRLWGKHFALLHRDREADNEFGITFGFTARFMSEFGERIAGTHQVANMGLLGGKMVRAGEIVKEVITANDLGYLFTNVVA